MSKKLGFYAKLVLLYLGLLTITVQSKLVDTKNSDDKSPLPSPEETGILATMTNIYFTTREAVRFAYDEIVYFENMYKTVDNIKAWYNNNMDRKDRIFDIADKIVNDPEDVFVTLRRMETMFDEIDELTLRQPYEFDKILAGGEFWWDQMAARNNEYGTGILIPNTQGVVDYVEGLFVKSKRISIKDMSYDTHHDSGLVNDILRRNKMIEDISSIDMSNWPYERVRKAIFIIASASMANSAEMFKWSIKANNSMRKNQEDFKVFKGVNGKQLQATWWSIETNNSNNKEIYHQIELLKNMTALLGVDVFMQSEYQNDYRKLRNAMRDIKIEMSKATK